MTETARIDGDGLLVAASDALAALNAAAGGAVGQPIAVPQLVTLVRLASKLRILVARGVTAADAKGDVEMWVRAVPDEAGGIALEVDDWRRRDAPRPLAVTTRDEATAGWRWETDAALRLTLVPADLAGGAPDALLGQPLSRLFTLTEDGDGGFPLLAALAVRGGFAGQRAQITGDERIVRLDGHARLSTDGGFAGFAGRAEAIVGTMATADAVEAGFTRRLDQALRLPLSKIVANAESIAARTDGPIGEAYGGYAEDIAAAGRHLLSLVDDLVDLQAIERADFAVAAEGIDLADLARRAAGLLQVRAADTGVTLVRPGEDAALPAVGEFRRVLQILVNLIGNAVRYSPAGAAVTVAVTRDGGFASATVSDRGKGIAVADQARIFEKFERVDASEPGGSGLGLYIARRLARAMGGDIVVASVPGEGARFTLTLPAGLDK